MLLFQATTIFFFSLCVFFLILSCFTLSVYAMNFASFGIYIWCAELISIVWFKTFVCIVRYIYTRVVYSHTNFSIVILKCFTEHNWISFICIFLLNFTLHSQLILHSLLRKNGEFSDLNQRWKWRRKKRVREKMEWRSHKNTNMNTSVKRILSFAN